MMKIKKIPAEKFVKGMKILKCDKSWLNPKLYESNMDEEQIIEMLKKYGVKEVTVGFDDLLEDDLKHKEDSHRENESDKILTNFVISDLYFSKHVYPLLKNQIKDLFSGISNSNFDYDKLNAITGHIFNNTLKNTIFVININKYQENEDEYLYNHSLNLAFWRILLENQ